MTRTRLYVVAVVLLMTDLACGGAAQPSNVQATSAGAAASTPAVQSSPTHAPAALAATTTPPPSATTQAIGLAAGWGYTCALTSGGGVKCWGDNGFGALGDGTVITQYPNSQPSPVDVIGLASGVTAIATGYSHACALTSGGGIKCWGHNDNGELGDGTTVTRTTPVDVNGLTSGVKAITAGWEYTCALTSAGAVECWGWNLKGDLRPGATVYRTTPLSVDGLSSGVTAITAGYIHACALTSGGGVKCWGSNLYGELGDGKVITQYPYSEASPVDVSGLTSGVTAISAGEYYTCALTSMGGVKCWGANSLGQLGDGTTVTRTTPVDVSGLSSGVTAIAAAGQHTCALTSAGGVKCWGDASSGQLGHSRVFYQNSHPVPMPVDVLGLTGGVSAIAAGDYHTCALTSGGGVKCWGVNFSGQLGDGTTTNRYTPVAVIGFGP